MNVQNRRVPIWPSQERSKVRFERILDVADELLLACLPEDLSIDKITKAAGLQAPSVYRLFPSVAAVIHGLAQRHLLAMAAYVQETELEPDLSWQEELRQGLIVCRRYYEINPQAAKLILSSSVSREVRISDRENVSRMAENALAGSNLLEASASWPPGTTHEDVLRRLEIMIDIVDAVWGQSFHYHREITDWYFEESVRAAIGYLELYLPKHI